MTNTGKKKRTPPPCPPLKKPRRILCIDVGGTGLKAAVISPRGTYLVKRVRVKTPKRRKPREIVKALADLAAPLGAFDHVTIGFPGMVKNGRVVSAPHFGTKDWKGFDLAGGHVQEVESRSSCSTMPMSRGLAVIEGKGLELVCTLGTGFGTAWFRDGELMPHMDLAHLAVHKKDDFDVYVGDKTRRKIGNAPLEQAGQETDRACWRLSSTMTSFIWAAATRRCVKFKLPRNVTIVSNDAGMEGGAFAWHSIKNGAFQAQVAKGSLGSARMCCAGRH